MTETFSTTTETILRGTPLHVGSQNAFVGLQHGAPEPLRIRSDLLGSDPDGSELTKWGTTSVAEGGSSLFRCVHLTDVQFADVKSPTRFEFVNRFAGVEEFALFIPGHRPQELLVASALLATTASIDALGPSSWSGRSVDLVITTGDLIDNAQDNELTSVLSILSGGVVRINSGVLDDRSLVQAYPFGDEWYWHPETGGDRYSNLGGFPVVPNLLTAALQDVHAAGLSVPWIACNGNHEVLVGGMGRVTHGAQELTVGRRKAMMVPASTTLHSSDEFHVAPERFLSMSPSQMVPHDEARHHLDLKGVITRYLEAPGSPIGHGFTHDNIAEHRAYYVFDPVDGVRILALDTAQCSGGAKGFLNFEQWRWLREALEAADASGRYVLVISHHPSTEIEEAAVGSDEVGISATELVALLSSFRSVVLWLNGHTHRNRVLSHRDPLVRDSGFWEVTSSSLADWPCQVRSIELLEFSDRLEIVCEMIDHAAAIAPQGIDSPLDLAAWHRLIAANSSSTGKSDRRCGGLLDRNVRLMVPRRVSK